MNWPWIMMCLSMNTNQNKILEYKTKNKKKEIKNAKKIIIKIVLKICK